MLCDKLQGIELNFPNRTANESGRLLDLYLQNKGGNAMCDEAVHILFSMNRWESKPQIVSDMKSGKHVVCDRYAYSGVVYSAAKGLDFEWCKNVDRGLVKPDMVFFLSADAE
jgi:dTMP kinase